MSLKETLDFVLKKITPTQPEQEQTDHGGELDRAGAHELFMPSILPAELWQETGRWALLERDMDNFLLGELSRARSISMGPEPLMAYLLAKEHDLKIIKTIYTFKEIGREDREIRKYLRRLYV